METEKTQRGRVMEILISTIPYVKALRDTLEGKDLEKIIDEDGRFTRRFWNKLTEDQEKDILSNLMQAGIKPDEVSPPEVSGRSFSVPAIFERIRAVLSKSS